MKKIITTLFIFALLALLPSSVNAQSISDQLEAIRQAATEISLQLGSNRDTVAEQNQNTDINQCAVNDDLRTENIRLKKQVADLKSQVSGDASVYETEEEILDLVYEKRSEAREQEEGRHVFEDTFINSVKSWDSDIEREFDKLIGVYKNLVPNFNMMYDPSAYSEYEVEKFGSYFVDWINKRRGYKPYPQLGKINNDSSSNNTNSINNFQHSGINILFNHNGAQRP
jgi:hypothetical protein